MPGQPARQNPMRETTVAIQSNTTHPAILVGAVVAILGSVVCGRARADAVTEWNERAGQASVTAGGAPIQNRIMAITHLAIHDALNAIDPRYESYTPQAPAAPGASAAAAVISAAFNTLSQTVPGQAATLQVIYENRLVELPPCPPQFPTCVQDGVAAGAAAASSILALRSNDGSTTPHLPYTLGPAPGVYQPTPPGYLPPQWAGWANTLPFAINYASQFRAPPVPFFNLRSYAYVHDFYEVKEFGNTVVRSANPDSDKSRVARFWPGGGANMNAVTRVIVAGRGLDMWQHAQLFALLNLASTDSTIAVFETKYHYNFWRPVTAIRAADSDSNPFTVADPAWLSYQVTPPYPDYTCGLTTNVGSVTEVLRQYFGTDKIAYTFTAAGITRNYQRLSDADEDAVDARVYGGMHFRTGCEQGIRYGGKVGKFMVQSQLRPLH